MCFAISFTNEDIKDIMFRTRAFLQATSTGDLLAIFVYLLPYNYSFLSFFFIYSLLATLYCQKPKV